MSWEVDHRREDQIPLQLCFKVTAAISKWVPDKLEGLIFSQQDDLLTIRAIQVATFLCCSTVQCYSILCYELETITGGAAMLSWVAWPILSSSSLPDMYWILGNSCRKYQYYRFKYPCVSLCMLSILQYCCILASSPYRIPACKVGNHRGQIHVFCPYVRVKHVFSPCVRITRTWIFARVPVGMHYP